MSTDLEKAFQEQKVKTFLEKLDALEKENGLKLIAVLQPSLQTLTATLKVVAIQNNEEEKKAQ